MDTRVATAELGWTAYPNSGVSLSYGHNVRKENGEKKAEFFKGDVKHKTQ